VEELTFGKWLQGNWNIVQASELIYSCINIPLSNLNPGNPYWQRVGGLSAESNNRAQILATITLLERLISIVLECENRCVGACEVVVYDI